MRHGAISDIGANVSDGPSNEEMERALQFIRDKAKEKGIAKGERTYLEEFRKSKKALLKIEARKNGIKSDCEAEDYAYAHPDYLACLTAIEAAVSRDEELRLKILAADLRIATWQTYRADERLERKAYQS
jgi:hypothetical protein